MLNQGINIRYATSFRGPMRAKGGMGTTTRYKNNRAKGDMGTKPSTKAG